MPVIIFIYCLSFFDRKKYKLKKNTRRVKTRLMVVVSLSLSPSRAQPWVDTKEDGANYCITKGAILR